ncbi:MAG: conjugal transfer protein TraX [Lachnospiraceae bacterium]|jgi:hypothetical protein|nr:conjugal transfer protein TraX [Lachnospiraceae bacterium]
MGAKEKTIKRNMEREEELEEVIQEFKDDVESVGTKIIRHIGLTNYQLKWIAIITMVIDHTGYVLYPAYPIFRYIGRLSFPIFCFLLVEGFYHTGNVKKYALRLGIFAILSEIPYDLAFHGKILEFGNGQNVFFTLLIGLLVLYVWERCRSLPVGIAAATAGMCLAALIKCDYSYTGVFLIWLIAFKRDQKPFMLFLAGIWNFLFYGKVQYWGAFACIPIALYNGKRGRKMKYFFYIFYPVHLLILHFISLAMYGKPL